MYNVTSTVRSRDCDPSEPIVMLAVDRAPFTNGFTVLNLSDLKPLADSGLIQSTCPRTGQIAKVRIFYSDYFERWIATTSRDSTTCDNLLSKPIVRAISREGSVSYFQYCRL